jgi:hypothetical protein
MSLPYCLMLALLMPAASVDDVPRLPNTEPLTWQGDIADRMMNGSHAYIERKIAHSAPTRQKFWKRDFSSWAAYEKSIQPNRERFQKIIGLRDQRVPEYMERFGDDINPALVAQTSRYRIYQVRWPVIDGVWGEGLLLEPKGQALAHVIALPDADQTPEQLCGLAPGVDKQAQFARRLAENGFEVVVPVLIDRSDEWSGNADIAWTNQPHREWIYRQACHMGRHVIGYEVQKLTAVVNWFKEHAGPASKVGVAGYGEGGLLAFYGAAVDERINACLVSGYFEDRQRPWEEPLYRNVWGLLHEFGDAEIATLIAPRGLVVEYSKVPAVNRPPPVRPGRRGGAAVGRLQTPPFASVRAEFQRMESLLQPGFPHAELVSDQAAPIGPGSPAALKKFVQFLGLESPMTLSDEMPVEQRKHLDPAGRQGRQVHELEGHVQRLVRGADQTRSRFFPLPKATDKVTPEQFIQPTPKYRQYLWEEVLGKLDDPLLPPNPRCRKVYDKEKWEGYEVVLDVFPDVFAWGVLLLPKDLKPGEQRPVVVCQHGRGGVP